MRRAAAALLLVAGVSLTGCATAADEGDDETSIVNEEGSDDSGEDSEDD